MILVVGATGFLGGEICRRLRARGDRVRALVRSTSEPGRVQLLRDAGAELVEGDLKDRASLDAACRGARVVITTASVTRSAQPGDSLRLTDQVGQMALVDAAKAARVEQFVYMSYSGNIEIAHALHEAKRGVERYLRESGLTYTILRPSVFMEVWLNPMLGFDYQGGAVRVYGTDDRAVSWISLGDVAEFAVQSIRNPAALNAVFELGGPEALTPSEVVRTFEDVTGRTFSVDHVPEDALLQQWEAAPDPTQKAFAGLMLGLARGDRIDMRETLAKLPVHLTSVREYAQRVTMGGRRTG